MNMYMVLLLILVVSSTCNSTGVQSKSGKKVASARVNIEEPQQHVLHFEFCSS